MKHGGEAMREVKKRLSELSTADVLARMEANGVPCAPVVGLADLAAQPQIARRACWRRSTTRCSGGWCSPGPRSASTARRSPDGRPSPTLGQHTDEILAEAGFNGAEIAELRRRSVVAEPPGVGGRPRSHRWASARRRCSRKARSAALVARARAAS